MSYFGITEDEIREKLTTLKKDLKSEEVAIRPNLGQLLGGYNHTGHTRCNICNVNGPNRRRYIGCQHTNGQLYVCDACTNSTEPVKGNHSCWQCGQAASRYGQIAFCLPHGKNQPKKDTTAIDVVDKVSKLLIPSKRVSNSKAKKAQPYIDSGLAEPFAMAIVEGTDDDEVLNLWEADWWKQYPAEDILIVSVLSGQHTESDGQYMNSVRSNHERLSLCCVVKDVTIDWARALLESGFDDHPDAVNSVLDGGEPRIVARIRKMKVNSETLPPGLGKSVSTLEKLKPIKFEFAEGNEELEEETNFDEI